VPVHYLDELSRLCRDDVALLNDVMAEQWIHMCLYRLDRTTLKRGTSEDSHLEVRLHLAWNIKWMFLKAWDGRSLGSLERQIYSIRRSSTILMKMIISQVSDRGAPFPESLKIASVVNGFVRNPERSKLRPGMILSDSSDERWQLSLVLFPQRL